MVDLLLKVMHDFRKIDSSFSRFTQFLSLKPIRFIHDVLDNFLLVVDTSTCIVFEILLPLSSLLLKGCSIPI